MIYLYLSCLKTYWAEIRNLIWLPHNILGKVVWREFWATYCCFNIFCHKMITSRWVLGFEVSIEPYWSAQHDRIFESGATAFLVAKIWTINSSISESFEELLSWNSKLKLITHKCISGTYFGAIVAILNFCYLGEGP